MDGNIGIPRNIFLFMQTNFSTAYFKQHEMTCMDHVVQPDLLLCLMAIINF
jgi:hypothetical protein